jgi:hypothetical protein
MTAFGSDWLGGAQLYWVPSRPGARLTLQVTAPAEGTYTIAGYFTKAPDYGRFQLSINGQKVGEPFNGFDPWVVHSGKVTLGTASLRAGENEFQFDIVDRDARSSGYMVGIDRLELTRVLLLVPAIRAAPTLKRSDLPPVR